MTSSKATWRRSFGLNGPGFEEFEVAGEGCRRAAHAM
jgi:hypothetical protein